LGIHSLLTVLKLFPRHFHSIVFMTVGVVDSATFQGVEEVDRVRVQAEEAMQKYVEQARRMGLPSDERVGLGTEAVSGCVRLAQEIAAEYPRAIFFAGKLIFERERWWDRLLPNETAFAIQRRLQIARQEVAAFVEYDFVVVNDEITTAVDRLRSIVVGERSRLRCMRGEAEHIVRTFI